MTEFIQKSKNSGHDIIVLGDTNNEVYDSPRIEKFLQTNDLYNVIRENMLVEV